MALPDILTSNDDDHDFSETEPLYGNADMAVHQRKPIPVDNLWNYVKEKKQSTTDSLKTEYDVSSSTLTCSGWLSYVGGVLLTLVPYRKQLKVMFKCLH